jgi:hypothetical protein
MAFCTVTKGGVYVTDIRVDGPGPGSGLRESTYLVNLKGPFRGIVTVASN